jgi:hypothetical protein
MIAIFFDFCQFTAKKWRFLSTHVVVNFFQEKTEVRAKTPNGETIVKLVTSVPGRPDRALRLLSSDRRWLGHYQGCRITARLSGWTPGSGSADAGPGVNAGTFFTIT